MSSHLATPTPLDSDKIKNEEKNIENDKHTNKEEPLEPTEQKEKEEEPKQSTIEHPISHKKPEKVTPHRLSVSDEQERTSLENMSQEELVTRLLKQQKLSLRYKTRFTEVCHLTSCDSHDEDSTNNDIYVLVM